MTNADKEANRQLLKKLRVERLEVERRRAAPGLTASERERLFLEKEALNDDIAAIERSLSQD
jgi:hypothetical protein